MKGWTIAIRPSVGQPLYKITKIISLEDGGFSVLTPYHKAQSGYLFRKPVDLDLQIQGTNRRITWRETEGYTVESQAKLSYHMDGFAQFSSGTSSQIISGRDDITGEPKGLGLITRPFKKPILGGFFLLPCVCVNIWGIDEFSEATQSDKSMLIFEPEEFHYVEGTTPNDANGWCLWIYILSLTSMPLQDHKIITEFGAELKIINFPTMKDKFGKALGLCVSHNVTKYPSKSGWIINGPGNGEYALTGIYPRNCINVGEKNSIDRNVGLKFV